MKQHTNLVQKPLPCVNTKLMKRGGNFEVLQISHVQCPQVFELVCYWWGTRLSCKGLKINRSCLVKYVINNIIKVSKNNFWIFSIILSNQSRNEQNVYLTERGWWCLRTMQPLVGKEKAKAISLQENRNVLLGTFLINFALQKWIWMRP